MSSEMRMQLKPQRYAALFVIIFALLFSTPLAGRQHSFITSRQQGDRAEAAENEALGQVHARMLSVKTNDYGSYDPAPSMEKPHFKLIPN